MPHNDMMQIMEEDSLKGKYLIFYLGKEQFGIEIRYITEIIGIQPITPIPNMPNYLKGVTNLRGNIIPVLDARLLFKKEFREYDARTCIIVLNINKISLGLIVDNVSEVISIDDKDIASASDMNIADIRYIKGIGKANGEVKLLLDCEKMLIDDEVEAIGTVN